MSSSRFDRITRAFAARSSRRSAVAAGMGTVAAALATGSARATFAQETATPAAATEPLFLYVQHFESGTLEPAADQLDRGVLTLFGASASTIVFADHPSRLTNLLPTEQLPEVLSFDAANPPNAALQTRTEDGTEIVLVVELLEPTFDADSRTVTYQVIELAEYSSIGAEFADRVQPLGAMPASFGLTSLFIDSGGDGCRENLTVCSTDDQCCGDSICALITCAPDDQSVTSYAGSNLPMCVPPMG